MISKSEFINLVRRGDPTFNENDQLLDNYEDSVIAAEKAERRMPGIGFMSAAQRMNAFISVCRHLDDMMKDDLVDEDGAQLAIIILRMSNKSFQKACVMFDIRGPRLGVRDIVDLPISARQYLSGINHPRY